MAGRIRTIKPEILEDEKTAALSHLEWRLFVSLFLIADDYGNLRGEPAYVRGQVLWATTENVEAVSRALEGLQRVSLLSRYSVRGQSYYHISGWDKHQKVQKVGKPRMPGPEQADPEPDPSVADHSGESPEDSGESPETLSPDLRPPISDHRPPSEVARAIPPAPSTTPAQSFAERDLAKLRERGALAEATWQRLSELRAGHAARLRISGVMPFPVVHPGNQPRGFRELLDRIREEGDNAHAACDHVLAVLDKQATDEKSIEWLAEKAFLAGPWEKARNTPLAKRKPAVAAQPSAPSEPKVYVSSAELAEIVAPIAPQLLGGKGPA
ncbi:MAG: hypothetical protein ACM358_04975 [Gemmatimonadota bacterium]